MRWSTEAMATYRATYLERLAERRHALEARRHRAWSVAQRAAELLRSRYGVDRVAVFGSLLTDLFDERSDVDLAVWGLPSSELFRAVALVTGVDSEIGVDLVRYEEASPSLKAVAAGGQSV